MHLDENWYSMKSMHKTRSGCMWVRLSVRKSMWLEKYRLFNVAFALCCSVALVGGWMNESFGQRLRYQKERFGSVDGGKTRATENQLVLVASGFLMCSAAE